MSGKRSLHVEKMGKCESSPGEELEDTPRRAVFLLVQTQSTEIPLTIISNRILRREKMQRACGDKQWVCARLASLRNRHLVMICGETWGCAM